MAKFNLTPNTLDKIKGNTILVKKDELEKFAKYATELRDKLEVSEIKVEQFKEQFKKQFQERIEELEKENKDLKKKLNQKILDEEIGKESIASKLDKENKKLKENLNSLEKKYERMEKIYLEKIKELLDNNNISLKNEVSKEIKDIKEILKNELRAELKNEFKKLESDETISKFEIVI